MKIKTKLTTTFTLLVASILTISFIGIYIFTMIYRQNEFLSRIRVNALNTATLLLNVEDISTEQLKIIDVSTKSTINGLNVWVLDKSKSILYGKTDSASTTKLLPSFNYMRWYNDNSRIKNDTTYLCLIHNYKDQEYFVLASAVDYTGLSQLRNLRVSMLSILGISILLIIFAGIINTQQTLKPIKEVIKHVDDINASNLNNRLDVSSKDEIAELSNTFNEMLERLERAFETEKMFVSNASHELRTPITSIKGQLEVALINPRSEAEYQKILSSIHDDVNNVTTIINGFLELAESNIEPGAISFEKLRIDEVVFIVKDEFVRRKPDSVVNIEFENMPEDENNIIINGNLRLLKGLITNLIDNACKFSENKKVIVKIGYDEQKVFLKFIDNGIGIPGDEINNIFQPLFRSKNANNKPGSGIGLSIVNRIANIHNAIIKVDSEINVGTSVTVAFPNIGHVS